LREGRGASFLNGAWAHSGCHGRCLYDAQTGKIWFRSTGDGRLVSPEHWEEANAGRMPPVVVERLYRALWWMLILGVMIVNGCLKLLW